MTAAFAARPYDGLIVRCIPPPAPPVSRLLLARSADDQPAVLLSGHGDPRLTRWSYGALEPIERPADLASARRELARFAPVPRGAELPPFVGGAVGFVGYDVGWKWAARPRPVRTVSDGLPSESWSIFDAVYALDARTQTGWLIAQDTPDAERRLKRLETALGRTCIIPVGATVHPPSPEISARLHRARIRYVLDLIEAGEVYQVNLTYRRSAPYRGAPEAAFLRLARNAPPFSAFFNAGDGRAVVSASPECFFTHDATRRSVSVYPIKGTRPRGADAAEDEALARALASNDKERAEHVMIVDLLRNDLGRIAAPGSVRVGELAYLEKFAAVQHLTSRIEARLPGPDSFESLFTALFPGGSITGAPKLRAMELIDAIEARPRGLYTGAVGFIAPDDTACFSIAIRTAEFAGGRVGFGVGGGIVADSDPGAEWEETEAKARTLTRILHSDGYRPRPSDA